MADDKEQVPAAGDGPTQEDKANKEADAEDASEPKAKYEILGRCYGLVTREVMRPKSCFRLPFSYKLPSPHLVVKKIIRDPKFGKALEDYLEKVDSEEARRIRELEKGCCTGCCVPRSKSSEPRSPGYGGRFDAIEKALKDNQAAVSASAQEASVAQPREAVAAAPPAPAASVGAPPAADNLV